MHVGEPWQHEASSVGASTTLGVAYEEDPARIAGFERGTHATTGAGLDEGDAIEAQSTSWHRKGVRG